MSEELKDVFKQAAEIAKTVPEPMQDAAFHRALDELLGTSEGQGSRGSGQSRTRGKRTQAKSKAADAKRVKKAGRKPTGGRRGPKAAVEVLIDAGYFNEPRAMGDITRRLELKLAHKYKASDLSPALGRLVRDGKLDREKNADNQYEYATPK